MLKAKRKLNILKYDLKSLENAVDSVKSGQMSVRKAAEHYNVPKLTVGDRVTGKRHRGKDWWQNFKERHTDLVIRKPDRTGSLRCRMMNRQKVEEYFHAFEKTLIEKDIAKKPTMIWNMDETGKSFEHDPVKVLAEKGTTNVPGRTSAMSKHVTIIACANAEGHKMSSLLIVTGKTERSVL
ncbi:unnamed protein product [Mytilus edulis]|uniref:HTH psq-type domain-containing protein n=1 Tax=Mytilus edulis TaxID=6550 RepID=A0A8S3R9Y6_MYTED|nr:unnamed protein product [Mytilus edulis]